MFSHPGNRVNIQEIFGLNIRSQETKTNISAVLVHTAGDGVIIPTGTGIIGLAEEINKQRLRKS